MIKVQGKIPRSVGVAVSGGVDSMAALNFLMRNHDVTVYNFDHSTEYGATAHNYLLDYCNFHKIPFVSCYLEKDKPKGLSWEEFWRIERYEWLTSFEQTIVLAHHLDDCVESYVFNMTHGKDYTIPYRHSNCIRPFRLNKKAEFLDWAVRNAVYWMDDVSNTDTKYARNQIRKNVIPELLKVNPGLYKVVARKLDEPF